MGRCGKDALDQLIELSLEQGTITAADCDRFGIDRKALTRGAEQGLLRRIARGRYRYRQCPDDHHPDTVEAELLRRKPGFIFVGPTAAYFHGLLPGPTDLIYVAISRNTHKPKLPGFRFVQFTGDRLVERVVRVEENLYVSEPAKAVVECFYFRKELPPGLPYLAFQNYEKQHSAIDLIRPATVFKVSRYVPIFSTPDSPELQSAS
ncbi:MAG: type IV toxin-antitoxin system AbiEi family antitoxin domain-containing protein [Myxococcaceae bacterium]